MKALSVKQPWANWIALGVKTIEVRSWATNYRGRLLICSSSSIDSNYKQKCSSLNLPMLDPRGVTLCLVDLVDVRFMQPTDWDSAFLCPTKFKKDHAYAWVLANPWPVIRNQVKGRLGLFDVDGTMFDV